MFTFVFQIIFMDVLSVGLSCKFNYC